MGKEWTSLICRHCGASLTSDETSCPQCGFDAQPLRIPPSAKIISLQQRRRVARRALHVPKGMRSTLWWLLFIIVAALVIPYLMPLHA
ncbi:MAG: zinc-ribbon domain-containing protein [Firmicutes bacterium]|nr:zinc-ribbon domain-containing protein [Bacillota bacterium]